jgi:hypothetical protein
MLIDRDMDGIVVRREDKTDEEFRARRVLALLELNRLKRSFRAASLVVFVCSLFIACSFFWPHRDHVVMRAFFLSFTAAMVCVGLLFMLLSLRRRD